MKKLNNNQKLLDKLNAQFAEELGFDVMLRDMICEKLTKIKAKALKMTKKGRK